MLNPISWIRGKVKDMLFYRAMRMAPVKRLGTVYVKEVQGNFYSVDEIVAIDYMIRTKKPCEVIPPPTRIDKVLP